MVAGHEGRMPQHTTTVDPPHKRHFSTIGGLCSFLEGMYGSRVVSWAFSILKTNPF